MTTFTQESRHYGRELDPRDVPFGGVTQVRRGRGGAVVLCPVSSRPPGSIPHTSRSGVKVLGTKCRRCL